MAELEDEAQWADAFTRSQDALAKLADETLAEFVAGDTELSGMRGAVREAPATH